MHHAPCTTKQIIKKKGCPTIKIGNRKKITNVTGKMRLFPFCSDYFSTSSVHWCRWRWTWMPFFLLYPLIGGTVTLIASLFQLFLLFSLPITLSVHFFSFSIIFSSPLRSSSFTVPLFAVFLSALPSLLIHPCTNHKYLISSYDFCITFLLSLLSPAFSMDMASSVDIFTIAAWSTDNVSRVIPGFYHE